MKLYILRHGRTDWNDEGLLQGWTDNPLNDLGRGQAQAVALQLKDIDFTICYTSPLLRARQTAELATGGKYKLQYDVLLAERYLGAKEGKLDDDTEFSALSWDWEQNSEIYGVEPVQALFRRAEEFLGKIKRQHADSDKILIVCHGGLMRALHYTLMGFDENTDFSALKTQNCDIKIYNI